MIVANALLLLVATGTVTLTLTDEHGKPIPDHEVLLAPTNSTKDVRPFGDLWPVDKTEATHRGKIDAAGKVAIKGVQKGLPMMVITRFGPRFDPYLRQENPCRGSMDIMKFEGAVYANRPARIKIASDYRIVGWVTQLDSGAPLSGARVILLDTMIGHMSGYPLTQIDETCTDSNGMFVFNRLPNCTFTVFVSPGPLTRVESRIDKGSWRFGYITDEGRYISKGSFGKALLLNKARTVCDFRTTPSGR